MAIKTLDHVNNIRVGNFVVIEVVPYPGSTSTFYRFSDVDFTYTIPVSGYGKDQYNQDITQFTFSKGPTVNQYRGRLVNITNSTSEIKGNTAPVTITLTGLPDDDLQDNILNENIKWAGVTIWRQLFDEFGAVIKESDLTTDLTPVQRFKGIISNYSVQETYENDTLESNAFVTLECSSAFNLLQKKTTGRMANQQSQANYFPNDRSMNRVTTIANTNFVFGFPKEKDV
jgi:hypothetical protein